MRIFVKLGDKTIPYDAEGNELLESIKLKLLTKELQNIGADKDSKDSKESRSLNDLVELLNKSYGGLQRRDINTSPIDFTKKFKIRKPFMNISKEDIKDFLLIRYNNKEDSITYLRSLLRDDLLRDGSAIDTKRIMRINANIRKKQDITEDDRNYINTYNSLTIDEMLDELVLPTITKEKKNNRGEKFSPEFVEHILTTYGEVIQKSKIVRKDNVVEYANKEIYDLVHPPKAALQKPPETPDDILSEEFDIFFKDVLKVNLKHNLYKNVIGLIETIYKIDKQCDKDKCINCKDLIEGDSKWKSISSYSNGVQFVCSFCDKECMENYHFEPLHTSDEYI